MLLLPDAAPSCLEELTAAATSCAAVAAAARIGLLFFPFLLQGSKRGSLDFGVILVVVVVSTQKILLIGTVVITPALH